MMRSQSRRGRGDAGASLVLAMAFMTGVGVVVGALLTFSSTAITSAKFTLEHAQDANDVAGGLQAAINTVRASDFNNGTGEDCLNASHSLTYPGGEVAVTCAPKSGTGASGTLVPISAKNKPGWALLTLGDNTDEPGIGQESNSVFRVHGKVQSNSTIEINGSECAATPQPPTDLNCSELYQTAPATSVIAKGTCSGRIVTTGSVECNSPVSPMDPAYPQPSAAGAVARTAPGCSSGTASAVSLSPGIYTDAVRLNALTSGGSACTSKVVLFTAGTYFFDFRNSASADRVWTIGNKDVTVIGGTPNGWSTSATAKPALELPGACISPLTTTTANSGVQFVFGGDSRLKVTAGDVELCGQWSANRPPITIYGAKADSGIDSGSATAAAVSSATAPAFTGLVNLSANDGIAATATFQNPNKATTASLVARGFGPSPTVPANSVLRKATLSVKHRVTGAGVTGLTATVAPKDGAARPADPLPVTTAWETSEVDLSSTLAASVAAGTLNDLNITVAAAAAKNSTATVGVDWISLALEWIPPTGIRAQTTRIGGADNCVGTAPYVPGVRNCAMITTDGKQTDFYVTGTTYAPLAALDIALTNASGQVFRSGLIARSVQMKVTASSDFTGAVIEVPDDTTLATATDLVVYFTAYRCPDGATCTGVAPPAAPWVEAGKAQVKYDDKGVFPPAAGARSVTVEAWQLLR